MYIEYRLYVQGIRSALDAVFGESDAWLRGPAGLFKAADQHALCWGILAECNANVSTCALDSITFHKKGNGTALAVAQGGVALMRDIGERFPNLRTMPYSNRCVGDK